MACSTCDELRKSQRHRRLCGQRLARLLLRRCTIQGGALRRLPPRPLDELHHALGAELLAMRRACCPRYALIHQHATHVVAAGCTAKGQGAIRTA